MNLTHIELLKLQGITYRTINNMKYKSASYQELCGVFQTLYEMTYNSLVVLQSVVTYLTYYTKSHPGLH